MNGLQGYRIKFSTRAINRWIKHRFLSVQPMMDQWYEYADQEFESKDGFWVFNGQRFSTLGDLKNAIDGYNAKLDSLLLRVFRV